MSVNPNEKLPISETIGLLSFCIFIGLPPFILFKEGPIFIFGNNPLLYLHIYSVIGGAICGMSFGKKMKFLGLISGVIAALGGTALFAYYAFSPPVKEMIRTTEILFTIGVGGLPGVMIYIVINKLVKRHLDKECT